jgi:hypothetical protein
MALMSISTGRCVPGRRDEFLALALEAMKLFERHGATHTRLVNAATAGESSNSYTMTNEFDTAAAYGTFADELFNDVEYDALTGRISAANSPLVIESRSVWNEIPLERRGPRAHGSILEAYVSELVPGQLEACLTFTAKAFAFLESKGATNCRLGRMALSGNSTEQLVATWEFASMRAWGTATDAWDGDPAAQALLATLLGTKSPIKPIWSGLYRDVHM